jgi:hypothetical protein
LKEAETQSVVLQATISDLYDFNYGSGGTGNAARGATVQVGAVRGTDIAGRIFQVEINIDKTATGTDTIKYGFLRNDESHYYHTLIFP